MRECARRFLTGETTRAICTRLNERGVVGGAAPVVAARSRTGDDDEGGDEDGYDNAGDGIVSPQRDRSFRGTTGEGANTLIVAVVCDGSTRLPTPIGWPVTVLNAGLINAEARLTPALRGV